MGRSGQRLLRVWACAPIDEMRSATQLMTTTEPAATTAQPPAATWQPAPLRARAKAAMADALLVIVIAILPTLMTLLLADGIGLGRSDNSEVRGAMALAFWCTATAYLAINQGEPGARNGQTTGKRHANIRVVRAVDGAPLSRGRAIARAAAIALILPIGLPLAVLVSALTGGWLGSEEIQGGLLWFLIGANIAHAAASPHRRTIFDLLTGTAVVEARRRTDASEPIGAQPRDWPALGVGVALALAAAYLWLA